MHKRNSNTQKYSLPTQPKQKVERKESIGLQSNQFQIRHLKQFRKALPTQHKTINQKSKRRHYDYFNTEDILKIQKKYNKAIHIMYTYPCTTIVYIIYCLLRYSVILYKITLPG